MTQTRLLMKRHVRRVTRRFSCAVRRGPVVGVPTIWCPGSTVIEVSCPARPPCRSRRFWRCTCSSRRIQGHFPNNFHTLRRFQPLRRVRCLCSWRRSTPCPAHINRSLASYPRQERDPERNTGTKLPHQPSAGSLADTSGNNKKKQWLMHFLPHDESLINLH